MKNGYDQFFKQARKAAQTQPSPVNRKILTELNKNSSRKKNHKKETPWGFIVFSFCGLLLTLGGATYVDDVESLFKKVEIGLLGSANAQEATAPSAQPKSEKSGETKDSAETKAQTESGPKEWTGEQIDHLSKLNERSKELEFKEEELKRMEAELLKQKEELAKRLQDLESTRSNISEVLRERVKADEQKVDTLVQLYTNMKPQNAAKVFETIDEDLAVQILGKMKKKSAADIMNLLKPEKAQILTEKYAGFKRDVATEKKQDSTTEGGQ